MEFDYQQQASWQPVGGQQQSPIAIDSQKAQGSELAAINWRALYQGLTIAKQATTVQLTGHGAATLNDREFTFQQLHFHAPAEHQIDGQVAPMELHFVHQSLSGQLAVIAVLVKAGKPNPAFQAILNAIPTTTEPLTFEQPLDLTSFLPLTGTVYHYLGSLTTPPLTEGVEWYVCADPIMLGRDQIDAYTNQFQPNQRSLQATNDRPILAERF